MPAPTLTSMLDGISTINRGMHSGISPRLLPTDQVAFAVNCTFRNGLPRTRPVFKQLTLSFPDASTETNATTALFQKAAFHQAYGGGENSLVASIGGRLFRYLVGSNNVVQDISISTTTTVGGGGFVIPAVNATVIVTVASTAGWLAGMPIVIAGANYVIVSVTNTTTAVLRNIDGVPGTVIAAAIAVTVYTDLNSSINPDCWMWQAEDFLIVQNGQKLPLFFDGSSTRRSLGQAGEELPAGCMGAYVQGRNWMVLPNNQKPSQTFMAGDLVYSHGFSDGYGGRSACLKTEENTLLSGGGAFSVPVSAGPITAMSSVAVQDTSLGQGPLQVFTRSSIFSVQVPLDRTEWADTQYPLMTIGLPNYGAVGAEAVTTVNGDIWYRSPDGIRSYQIARRNMGSWVNTPLSVEVERILSFDAEGLLGNTSTILFDNRFLVTCSPQLIRGRGTVHHGFIALDFNNISNLTTRSNPCYDGLWTGINVLQFVKGTFNGIERLFAFALDCDANIVLYEVLADGRGMFDWDGTQDVAIESWIESRSMQWKDGGNLLKELKCADLYLDKLAGPGAGQVNFAFYYRSDEDPFWQPWHAFSLCAVVKDCSTVNCPPFREIKPQYRTYLRLPEPQDKCSNLTHRRTRTGYEFQIKMWVKGYWQLNRLHTWAEPRSDSVVTSCPTSQNCTLVSCIPSDEGPGTTPGTGMVGIITEDGEWITDESGQQVLRTQDQPQFP